MPRVRSPHLPLPDSLLVFPTLMGGERCNVRVKSQSPSQGSDAELAKFCPKFLILSSNVTNKGNMQLIDWQDLEGIIFSSYLFLF